MAPADIRHALTRIQMEFMEMPEMRLTGAQMRRLLNLSVEVCELALATLVQSGFLTSAADGAFQRGVMPIRRSTPPDGHAERPAHVG